METKKRYRKMTKGERFIVVLVTILALLLSYMLIKPILQTWKPFSSAQSVLNADNSYYAMQEDVKEEDLQHGLELEQIIQGQYTILCLGMDEEGLNTDVMMLALFDLAGGKLNILQLPRDTYVAEYTNSETGKLNSVYSQGTLGYDSINNVVETVKNMFGIPIDSFMAINCNDIPPVVDAMGGIPINVPEQIIYEPDKVIEAGEQVIDGQQSEWFVRFRHDYLQGDIGRMKAQRMFLAAAMQKVKNLGTTKVMKLFPTFQKYLISDLELGEIGKLSDFAQTVTMDNVTVRMLPGEDVAPAKFNGYSVWSVHLEETINTLNTYFRPYQEYKYAEDLDLVELQNTHDYYDNDQNSFDEILSGNMESIPRNPEQ